MKTHDVISATVEEYLETIYNISMEGETVIGARLAERFGVSAPTVTEMLKRLVRGGYIEMDMKRHITLTETGNTLAESVLRRHRLTERFLVEMLGMQWHEVHEEACRLEHFISGAVEERVIASLHNPLTCPHGNPIPGSVPNARTYLNDKHAVRLATIAVGQSVTVLCISEVVEDEEALILYMHERGLLPDTRLVITQNVSSEVNEPVQIRVNEDHEVSLSREAAEKVWVVAS